MKVKAEIQSSPIGLFYLGLFGLTPEGFDAASDLEIAGYASICMLKLQGDHEPTLDQIRAGALLAESRTIEGPRKEAAKRSKFQERLAAMQKDDQQAGPTNGRNMPKYFCVCGKCYVTPEAAAHCCAGE